MTVETLIKDIKVKSITGNAGVTVSALAIDSRKTEKNGLFFAQVGTQADGHDFIDQVIDNGVVAIVCQKLPANIKPGVCYIQVEQVSAVIGIIAAAFYGYPTRKLKVIGVTGTNGKTTVATLLYRLFQQLGYKCGLISTVQNHIGDAVVPATHTTPDQVSLQALFARMESEGCSRVFMEVSSHAIHQHRIEGIDFDGAIFTNITHDHLDYHKTFDEYIKVKKTFFDNLAPGSFALTNLDDKRGPVMLQNTQALKKSYSLRSPADFKGKVLENDLDGLLMSIDKMEVHFRLTGLFNAYNLMAVYGAALLCGEDKIQVLSALSNIQGAPGRFETYRSSREKVLGIIDYAHTPDALLNVLATIKQFGSERQIITVVGCGGDRDRTKRPLMAQVACEHSGKVILTSDNPRSEDPEAILNDMESGLSFSHKRKVLRISDRREAIKTACSLARQEDVILVAGKGHENYQEIKGVKHHFDDKEVLLEMFDLLEK